MCILTIIIYMQKQAIERQKEGSVILLEQNTDACEAFLALENCHCACSITSYTKYTRYTSYYNQDD